MRFRETLEKWTLSELVCADGVIWSLERGILWLPHCEREMINGLNCIDTRGFRGAQL